MKKLFVSLPMNGRDEIDIREDMEALRAIAEDYCECEFELIDTYEYDTPDDVNNEAPYYLGKSIQNLAKADMVIFAPDWKIARGCIIEHMACALYDIPYVELHTDDMGNGFQDVAYDYTHSLDEQPVEIVEPLSDILHEDGGDTLDGNEKLAGPDADDVVDLDDIDIDELEPGEYDADAE